MLVKMTSKVSVELPVIVTASEIIAEDEPVAEAVVVESDPAALEE